MNSDDTWQSIGSAEELKRTPLQQIKVAGKAVALSYQDGKFGAVGGNCLHAGGPLGMASSKTGASSARGMAGR